MFKFLEIYLSNYIVLRLYHHLTYANPHVAVKLLLQFPIVVKTFYLYCMTFIQQQQLYKHETYSMNHHICTVYNVLNICDGCTTCFNYNTN